MNDAPRCRHCSADLIAAQTVRLWDGNDYCSGCVEEACAGLADYAGAHERLQETMPEEVNESLPTPFRFWVAASPWSRYVSIGAAIWIAFEGYYVASLILFAVAVVACLMEWHLATFVRCGLYRYSGELPTVRIEDGIVQVVRGPKLIAHIPLAECKWWHPEMRRHPAGRPDSPLLHHIVLFLPFPWWQVKERGVMCGYSTEMMAYWKAFLELAGIPRTTG